jgi:hypothetical protein
MNDPLGLEFAFQHGHGCALDAEETGKAVLRQGKRIVAGTIMCLQEPSAQTLADVMYGVAAKQLVRLFEQALGVADNHLPKALAPGRGFGQARD